MKTSRLIIAISIIVIIFGGIFASDALGLWETSASRNLGGGNQGSESHDDTGGESSEEDHSSFEVSGETTIGQALEMGIPEAILVQYFGDISDKNAVIKDLATDLGLSFGKLKSELNAYIKEE